MERKNLKVIGMQVGARNAQSCAGVKEMRQRIAVFVVAGLLGLALPGLAQCYWEQIASGSGSMLWTGDSDWWTGLYLYAGTTYRFTLTMPCSADFDLFVNRVWFDFWGTRNRVFPALCKGEAGRCVTEDFTCYISTTGYYDMNVISYSGSGSYTIRVYRRRC